MSGPCCPEVSSTSDQKKFKTPKVPHHSLLHIEDQPNTHISLPPLWSHDPITQDLEEYYTTSALAKHKLLVFLMFSWMSQSKEYVCLPYVGSASQHHRTSTGCLFYAFALFYSVDVLELETCWSSLIYISCLLVNMHNFLVNHTFTNMG